MLDILSKYDLATGVYTVCSILPLLNLKTIESRGRLPNQVHTHKKGNRMVNDLIKEDELNQNLMKY